MRILLIVVILLSMLACNIEVNSRDDYKPSEIKKMAVGESLESFTAANYELNMSGGELIIADTKDSLLTAYLEYTIEKFKPIYTIESIGNTANIKLKHTEDETNKEFGYNSWKVYLNKDIDTSLKLELGLGKSDIDLSEININDVELQMGMGEAKVRIGGDYLHNVNIKVVGGIGKLIISVPSYINVNADIEKGIGGIKSLDWEKENEKYHNPNADADKSMVNLDVVCGLGEIAIEYFDKI